MKRVKLTVAYDGTNYCGWQVPVSYTHLLRGRVLPIGGLKEKMLAAKYAGITKFLVPDQNRPDVEEIDGEIKDDLTIVFVEKMEPVSYTHLFQVFSAFFDFRSPKTPCGPLPVNSDGFLTLFRIS